jgi:hypothetical protein
MDTARFKFGILLLGLAFSSQFSSFAYAARGGSSGGGGFSSSLGGGGVAIGINMGIVNADQPAMNEIIKRANTGSNGPVSTGQMHTAYEIAPFLTYRLSDSIVAMQLRPSYFYQNEGGSGENGSYEMSVTGWTIFPMMRLYPLENEGMKFYMQFGLGYGRMNGEINEGAGNQVRFESGAFGTIVGLGAEFCFTANHCLNFEGDYRYLSLERSRVTKSSGTMTDLTQYGKGKELEMDGADMAVRMGGLMYLAGYTYWF